VRLKREDTQKLCLYGTKRQVEATLSGKKYLSLKKSPVSHLAFHGNKIKNEIDNTVSELVYIYAVGDG
jgi:hypothetical protein